jgi:hypothetical protein
MSKDGPTNSAFCCRHCQKKLFVMHVGTATRTIEVPLCYPVEQTPNLSWVDSGQTTTILQTGYVTVEGLRGEQPTQPLKWLPAIHPPFRVVHTDEERWKEIDL